MLLRLSRRAPAGLDYALAAALVAFWTPLLLWVQRVVAQAEGDHAVRAFTIGYLPPIGVVAAVGGRRPGFLALGLCLLATVFVLTPHGFGDFTAHARNWVELAFLAAVGWSQVVGMGTLRDNLQLQQEVSAREASLNALQKDLTRRQADLAESEERRLAFSREVLQAATGGRLDLCPEHELTARVSGEPLLALDLRHPSDVAVLRTRTKALLPGEGLPGPRMDDLLLCLTEAGTNAVKHGGGGTAWVWVRSDAGGQEVRVLIRDRGPGISSANLARATLERGFSTQESLGMGYYLMMESADGLALSTSSEGTSLLIRITSRPRRSIEESILASFGSIGRLEAA